MEKMRADSEIANNSVKTQSETIKRNAEAINALANAESKEAGLDNPAYIREAKDISLFTNEQAKETANDTITTPEQNAQELYQTGL